MPKPKTYCRNCRREIDYETPKCDYCGTRNQRWQPEEDNICHNCRSALEEEEQQCPVCGYKRQNHKLSEIERELQILYGPPPVTKLQS